MGQCVENEQFGWRRSLPTTPSTAARVTDLSCGDDSDSESVKYNNNNNLFSSLADCIKANQFLFL